MPKPEILVLEDVRRELGGRMVLDGVLLSVRRGQLAGVYGPSGTGKTTLAKIVAGLDLDFAGKRLLHPPEYAEDQARRGPHLVFQDSMQALNPRLPIVWTLAEAAAGNGSLLAIARARRTRIGEIHDALTAVGLPHDLLRLSPGALSGGQRQRVALARALLSRSELLVLDEPVAALDPSVQARILNLLKRLHAEQNRTLLIISHDPDVLGFLCDVQYELRGGKLWKDRS